MKSQTRFLFIFTSLIAFLLLTGCDWESGSQEDFNESSGDTSNTSGLYEGVLSGGRAVNNSTNIRFLTISQSGNVVQVIDNNGSEYSGTVGNLLSSRTNTDQLTEVGTTYFTIQISFEGINNVTGNLATFTGVVEIQEDSVIIAFIRDNDDNVADVLSDVQLTQFLKGNWIEPGQNGSVFAQIDPPDPSATP